MGDAPCSLDCAKCLPTSYDFGIAAPSVQVATAEVDGMRTAKITIPTAGTYVPQHSHQYAHITFLAAGSMRAWVEGELIGDFVAPFSLTISAARKHTFLALTDGVEFHCIHNVTRTGKVDELEQHQLPGYEPPPIILEDGDDGVSFREERFEPFWRDAQKLIAEHSAEIGPREGVTLDVNADVFRKLDATGKLQIVTSRCNGRLFGYLVSIIGPSLENPRITVGTQTAWFTSKDFRGLGRKLATVSIDRLKSKGVGEIHMRAGVRGSGRKAGAFFRRMGAQPHGELFALIVEPV